MKSGEKLEPLVRKAALNDEIDMMAAIPDIKMLEVTALCRIADALCDIAAKLK